jgi:hypothetical protein
MKTKITLFVAVLFTNCLLAVELPDGVSAKSKDPLVQAYIKAKGDIVRAIYIVNQTNRGPHGALWRATCDSHGHLIEVQLNDIKGLGDESLILLSQVPTIKSLFVGATAVTDAGMMHVVKLGNLEALGIARTQVTDEGLKSLHKLPKLREIIAYGSVGITDQGLKHLALCKNLYDVSVSDCKKITVKGLSHLANLLKLRSIEVSGTSINKKEAEGFMGKHPKITLHPFKK